MYFFSLLTTFTTPWLREKPFFHFGITLQKKKFDFYWTTTIMKKLFFFISLGRSLWKYLLTWSYIAHYITNLSKKFPNGILPGKNMCNLKNFLPQEFQWSLTWFTYQLFGVTPAKFNRGWESMLSNLLQIFTISFFLWEKYYLKHSASQLNSVLFHDCLKF